MIDKEMLRKRILLSSDYFDSHMNNIVKNAHFDEDTRIFIDEFTKTISHSLGELESAVLELIENS